MYSVFNKKISSGPIWPISLIILCQDQINCIHTLCQQFPTLIDESTVLNEWNQFKFDNMAASPSTFLKSPWSFYQPYQTSYPELWKLIQLLLHVVLPINSASCERGFSKMKIIKTDRRNRLSSD